MSSIIKAEATIGNYTLEAISSINPITGVRQTTYSLDLAVLNKVEGDIELQGFFGTSTEIVEFGPVDSLPGYVRIKIGDNTIYTTPELVAVMRDILPTLRATVDADIARQLEPPPLQPPTPTIDNVEEPTPPPAAENNALSGVANDDSGQGQPNSAESSPIPTAAESPAQVALPQDPVGSDAPAEREENETPTISLGEPGTPPYDNEGFIRVPRTGSRPGRRESNPLRHLASYTYQLSLYMISPEAYEAFVNSGRKDVNVLRRGILSSTENGNEPNREEGIYLVAQSSGMGPPEFRAPGFEFDYFIDNLSCKSSINGAQTQGPVAMTEITFQITEPYGFSFVTNLRNAQEKINKAAGNPPNENPTRQFYILGIRFFGWDQAGNQLTGNEIIDGEILDPHASGTGALFENYLDIVISELKFKLDGRSTVYNIKAASTNISSVVNVTKGTTTKPLEVIGSTVRDMISGPSGLLTNLNKEQKDLADNGTVQYPITYKVQWLGNDAEEIALSNMVTGNQTNKNNQPGTNAKNTDESNPSEEITAKPNKDAQRKDFSSGLPITQIIEQIIVSSSYLQDALTKNYKDSNEFDPETNKPDSVTGKNKKVKWFNISPRIQNIKWDYLRKDWVYDIVYVIQTYMIPVVNNLYVANTENYYGPHKRYEYWYTGKNTEIIAYEQALDNAYFNTFIDYPEPNDNSNNTGNAATNQELSSPNMVNTTPGGDQTGSQGTPSLSAANSFRTSLYDPQNFARAKIQILGDPDYLMQDVQQSTTLNSSLEKFYGPNFTINPNGGQVFIEIDFKEAVDYTKTGTSDLSFKFGRGVTGAPGTLSINDSIEFWRYPNESLQEEIKGLSYLLHTVVSTFQGGSFRQQLTAAVNVLGGSEALSSSAREEEEAEAAENPAEVVGTPEDPQSVEPQLGVD